MKNILSIDTSGEYCSIALLTPEQNYTFHQHRPREHANILLTEVEKLLTQAEMSIQQLDAVVYGRGPGSFTGIRIAAGVAQGIAMAVKCPIIPVSTLQSLAWSAAQQNIASSWVALDARMSEVYFAVYKLNNERVPELDTAERVLPPKHITETLSDGSSLIGNGWKAGYELSPKIAEAVETSDIHILVPNALDSAQLALALYQQDKSVAVSPELALPTYLRDNVTWDNKPKVGS
ncbi:tRNA (adenosine(37)-N6)-threonylcarbamoyltransferase complex dimerization subunit type 1 TsaB [Reinekea sp.]|jgi:tRNA threonylcarbamoyladenosine biosynthesis protein TsaB|uniref:tRNA (adenosine(37)-N6)-threonylcarbamoyltransferase complex dimerization subunit type 1 TsaB n=1 Tax=Reinekea sp. TaxID=1970455 RepID=UPI003988E568